MRKKTKVALKNSMWMLEFFEVVQTKRRRDGPDGLTALERLAYCLFVADYAMCNTSTLKWANKFYPRYQEEGLQLAIELSLERTMEMWNLKKAQLELEYLTRFPDVCEEIKKYSERP